MWQMCREMSQEDYKKAFRLMDFTDIISEKYLKA
jgi:hypothetical protein